METLKEMETLQTSKILKLIQVNLTVNTTNNTQKKILNKPNLLIQVDLELKRMVRKKKVKVKFLSRVIM